jgi:hypothetical protein
MAQVFPKWANRLPILSLAILVGGAGLAPLFAWYYFSPEYTDVGYQPVQPVPYSHKLHVGELGLDCRFCHSTVERSAVASVPPTEACMGCHQVVKRDSPDLAPIIKSATTDQPMRWVRIHKVPEYAYFDHSAHLGAGVGCSSCHGDVAAMEVVVQAKPLSMGWCLECHRDPAPHLRDFDEITDTAWKAPADQLERGNRFLEERQLAPPEDCTSCHR